MTKHVLSSIRSKILSRREQPRRSCRSKMTTKSCYSVIRQHLLKIQIVRTTIIATCFASLVEPSLRYIVLYCRLFNFSFYNSEYTLIKTKIKRFQVLHKTVHLLQNEHAHLLSRNQVLIKFLNCLVFCAVFIDSGSEFQILGP